MKNLVRIGLIIFMVWWFFGKNFKIPDIIKPEPIVVELVKPDSFVEETSKVKELVPDEAELDLLIFNDEFANKIKSYKDSEVTTDFFISKLYPMSFSEAFSKKYIGKLGKYGDFQKNFIETNISGKEMYLTLEELNKLHDFYKAVSWNLSP